MCLHLHNCLSLQLNHYAKFNSIGQVYVEENSNIVAVCDSELTDKKYSSTLYLTPFLLIIFGLPLSLICLLVIVVKSLQNPIRRSIRKKSNHPNIAALALTGLYISVFILAMDTSAMVMVFRNKHELSNHNFKHYYPLNFVFVCFALDAFFLAIITFVYTILFINYFCAKNKWSKRIIVFCFACMYYPVFGLIKTKDKGQIAASCVTNRTSNVERTLNMFSEYQVWLVLSGFVATFICLLSHIGFIVVAWVSAPEHAWSTTLLTLFSFLFFFFMFRQSYIRFNNLKPGPKDAYDRCACIIRYFCCLCCWFYACCCNENSCCQEEAGDILEELDALNIDEENNKDDKVEEKSIDFDFRAFFISGVLGLFISGIQALIMFSFIELPFSTDTTPSYILNILQLTFLVTATLIAYNVFALRKPTEQFILEKVTKILNHLPERRPRSNTL